MEISQRKKPNNFLVMIKTHRNSKILTAINSNYSSWYKFILKRIKNYLTKTNSWSRQTNFTEKFKNSIYCTAKIETKENNSCLVFYIGPTKTGCPLELLP